MIKQFTPNIRWMILVNEVDVPTIEIGLTDDEYRCMMVCRSFDQIEKNRQRVVKYLQRNRPKEPVTL